ncbi:MAG: S26 family signal peptidase [Leptonema sp. (in: bacteria)]
MQKEITYYKRKSKKTNYFFFISILLIVYFFLVLFANFFFVRIIEIHSLLRNHKKTYLVNLFSKNFKINDFVLIQHPFEKDLLIPAKIVATNGDKVQVFRDFIEIDSSKIFLKYSLPEEIMKKETYTLKENEIFVVSDTSIDSFELGILEKRNIIGKILYEF